MDMWLIGVIAVAVVIVMIIIISNIRIVPQSHPRLRVGI